MKPTTYLYLIPLSLLWPGIHLAVFLIRFGHMPPNGISEALVFLPMGLLSGLVLLYALNKSQTPRGRRGSIFGYIIASPFAFLLSLTVGMIFSPWIGVTVFGALPLVLGALVGQTVGDRIGQRPM